MEAAERARRLISECNRESSSGHKLAIYLFSLRSLSLSDSSSCTSRESFIKVAVESSEKRLVVVYGFKSIFCALLTPQVALHLHENFECELLRDEIWPVAAAAAYICPCYLIAGQEYHVTHKTERREEKTNKLNASAREMAAQSYFIRAFRRQRISLGFDNKNSHHKCIHIFRGVNAIATVFLISSPSPLSVSLACFRILTIIIIVVVVVHSFEKKRHIKH
jgi:hypothetical protein